MNTKHYTSIEMSKRLLELGLNPDTSDMYYLRVVGETYNQDTDMVLPMTDNNSKIQIGSLTEEYYPADDMFPSWSLSALLELIPHTGFDGIELNNYNDGKTIWTAIFHWKTDGTPIRIADTPLDAVCEIVVWLLENGFIKK